VVFGLIKKSLASCKFDIINIRLNKREIFQKKEKDIIWFVYLTDIFFYTEDGMANKFSSKIIHTKYINTIKNLIFLVILIYLIVKQIYGKKWKNLKIPVMNVSIGKALVYAK
jgi:hypothetical protein